VIGGKRSYGAQAGYNRAMGLARPPGYTQTITPEIVAILKPWEEPDQSWRILSSPIPMMMRSQMSNFQLDGNVNYYIQAFIYARRSKGSKHTEDYQWIVGKDNVLLKTGVCRTIERAQRNADFFLRKLKCRLLNHKHQAFA